MKPNIKTRNLKINVQRYDFTNRTIDHWNALPEDLMYGNICTKFKEHYENLVFKQYVHHKLSTILENTHTTLLKCPMLSREWWFKKRYQNQTPLNKSDY